MLLSRLNWIIAIPLFNCLNKSSLNRLQSVQNAAGRLLTNSRKRSDIVPILKSLHWLPVSFRISFTPLVLIFKALHAKTPQAFGIVAPKLWNELPSFFHFINSEEAFKTFLFRQAFG
ncbi:hypothetical protein LDENG_00120480 [Lucifuga dentata]|nr:hypothetical protein LDENG_00120480 [Lucifuga dentata]